MSLISLPQAPPPRAALSPGDRCDCIHGEQRDERDKPGRIVPSLHCCQCRNTGTVLPPDEQGVGTQARTSATA